MAGLFYIIFASLAVPVLLGLNTGNSDTLARDWTAWLLTLRFGPWLIGSIGLAIIGIGIGTAVAGFRADFAKRIALSAEPRQFVVALGIFGYATRAIVFTMIGLFFVFAAINANANEAAGVAGTLVAIQRQRHGTLLLGITAAGLLAFGGFGIAEALFRRIPADQSGSGRASWRGI